jgi:lysophospholipase L1-like esterase
MNPVIRAAGAVSAVVAGQLAWAIWRPLPTYQDLDPNGCEGPPEGNPLRIVVLGDSSCTGAGLSDPQDIWMRVLARRLGGHGYRVEIASFAVGGSKAVDLVREQVEPAVALGGDIALVSVGGNDALRGVGIGTFEAALDAIVSRLRTAFPVVALSGVGDIGTVPRLPPVIAAAARSRGRTLNTVHHTVASRHNALVADQWAWAAARFRDRTVFAADLFHPNEEGHRVWADVAYELISPVVAAGPASRA